MDPAAALEAARAARVARLATVRPEGGPHVVPVVFALVGGPRIAFAVDGKPKRSRDLQRLRNIRADPRVSVLVDGYREDWSALWWVRLDGTARVVTEVGEQALLLAALTVKYPQYAARPPGGPLVVVDVERVTSWSGGAAG